MKQTTNTTRGKVRLAPYERAVVSNGGTFSVATTSTVRSSARQRVVVVDTRPMTYPVQGQEIATSDEVAVRISLTSTVTVVDPIAYATGSQNVHADLHYRLQTALRRVVPTLTLEALLAQRSDLVLDAARILTEQPSLYDLRLLQQLGGGVNTVVVGNRSTE